MSFEISQLSSVQLRRAADIKERMDALQRELDDILGNVTRTPEARNMSAAGRARIAAASRARWEKYRKERGLPEPSKASKQKRYLSAAGRAAIVAAAKARWARFHRQA